MAATILRDSRRSWRDFFRANLAGVGNMLSGRATQGWLAASDFAIVLPELACKYSATRDSGAVATPGVERP